jgi:hypothetical protein
VAWHDAVQTVVSVAVADIEDSVESVVDNSVEPVANDEG